MNKVILVGALGNDPELKMSQNGNGVLKLRVATTESIKRGENWEKVTEWHNVVVFGKRGETLANLLEKGSKVGVEGRLTTSSWEDKDGNKRFKTEVIAADVEILSWKGSPSDGQSKQNKDISSNDCDVDGDVSDDIPF